MVIENINQLDIAIIGVPFVGGVENRPGARFGPRDVRNMSSMLRSIHHVTRIDPFKNRKIADVGDVPIEHYYQINEAHRDITKFYEKVYAAAKKAEEINVENDLQSMRRQPSRHGRRRSRQEKQAERELLRKKLADQ